MEVEQKPKGLSCRKAGCFFVFFIAACCILLAGVLTLRPSFLWIPVAKVLNGNTTINKVSQESIDEARQNVVNQIKPIDNLVIKLDEQTFSTLVSDKFKNLGSVSASLSENKIEIFWIIDQTFSESPIIGLISFDTSNPNLVLSHFGTAGINTPTQLSFLSKLIIVPLLGQDFEMFSSAEFVLQIIAPKAEFEAKSITVKDDYLELIVNAALYD